MTFWFAATFSQLLASLHNKGRSAQKICQIVSSCLQSSPCLAGIPLTAWLLMMPAWWHLLANISSLASSTPSAVLDLSYIQTQLNLSKISMSVQLLLMETDLICRRHQLSHHIHHIFFPLSQRQNIKSRDWCGSECPCSSVAQWMRTVHGQESNSSAEFGHMQFIAAIDQSPGELTSYWLLWKECQCHWFLPWGLPQSFLLLSHDWYVWRSSCPPPHDYRANSSKLSECACIVGGRSNVAYSSNVLKLLGDLVFMMAAWWA